MKIKGFSKSPQMDSFTLKALSLMLTVYFFVLLGKLRGGDGDKGEGGDEGDDGDEGDRFDLHFKLSWSNMKSIGLRST